MAKKQTRKRSKKQDESVDVTRQDRRLRTDDEQRADDRAFSARKAYPLQTEAEKDLDKQTERQIRSRRQNDKATNQDDVAPKLEGPPQPTAQIDHAVLNHPREEHMHRMQASVARIEGPAPRDPRGVEDLAVILEQIRLEEKADNLYYMRARERSADKPRQGVVEAINTRLREVQGDPISL